MNSESDDRDVAVAVGQAHANSKRFISALPRDLKKREDKLLERFRGTRADLIKQLSMLYLFADELVSGARRFTPCKKGCSGCCHYNVHMHEVEVAYIEAHTSHRRLPAFLEPRDYHGTPCPFLAQGECSIYESRPLKCRMHLAFTRTAYWCDPAHCNDPKAADMPGVTFSEVGKALTLIASRDGNVQPFDIRQAFGLSQ